MVVQITRDWLSVFILALSSARHDLTAKTAIMLECQNVDATHLYDCRRESMASIAAQRLDVRKVVDVDVVAARVERSLARPLHHQRPRAALARHAPKECVLDAFDYSNAYLCSCRESLCRFS